MRSEVSIKQVGKTIQVVVDSRSGVQVIFLSEFEAYEVMSGLISEFHRREQ